ncbi:hypothetical protein HN385_00420 [archaeon]|jgi:hypothetical protein|nr:hypothetical protein [archaeon]MBT3451612.1 hypothetical protein [archaeon]MBT6869633.1 hypothetical protein [archaeon]MBT7192401.1 hypothetical protein [archaeon]MBT7380202.1 hypothetical protein [archaeon]
MSQERVSEIRIALLDLESKIRPLQWDSNRNQINPFKKIELGRLNEQKNLLNKELNELEKP